MPKLRLLLIHGWGTNQSVWRLQEPLSRDFEVQTVELPGHGGPERWDRPDLSPGLRTIERLLADGAPTVAVGWSLGGQLIFSMGHRTPPSLKGLVAVGATPSLVRRPGFPQGLSSARVRIMQTEATQDFDAALRNFYPVNFSDAEKKASAYADWLEVLDRGKAKVVRDDALRCLEGIIQEDSRSGLAKFSLPVLVVNGTSDAVCPFGVATFLTEALPHGRIRAFQDAGHVPFITRAEEFNRIVREFTMETDGQ
jgi:pimeloyl-[acyl-carrier protein] methyl ester esterase